MVRALVDAGMDVARRNMSHGDYSDHKAAYDRVRAASDATARAVGILGDLQGPKIRIGKFEEGKIDLVVGASLILDAQCTIGNTEGGVPKVRCVSPAITDWMAGAPPRNGMCCICTPATRPNRAAPRCGAEPLPDVA